MYTKHKILLLHGMGGKGSLFRPLIALLEDSCDVLAPDQIGHGTQRDYQGPVTPSDFGHHICETLKTFHPCIGVGHSMGVRSLLAAAALKPDFFSALILIDLGVSGVPSHHTQLEKLFMGMPEVFENKQHAKDYLDAMCPDVGIKQYLMASCAPYQGGMMFGFHPHTMLRIIDTLRTTNTLKEAQSLAASGMPMYFLRGGNSTVLSEKQFLDEQELIQGAQTHWMTIPDTGHGLPFDQKKKLADLLLSIAQNRRIHND